MEWWTGSGGRHCIAAEDKEWWTGCGASPLASDSRSGTCQVPAVAPQTGLGKSGSLLAAAGTKA